MANESRVVSSDAEELILVDAEDNETGYRSKGECHDGAGLLHRAFSVFLFDDSGRLLLQQRADSKRLWPGYWSNSCCSHPRRGESVVVATARRLHDELNIESDLEYVYKFSYQAQFDDIGSEHELCHVYVGKVQGVLQPNENEIQALRLVSADELELELNTAPDQFTPWFRMEWQTLNEQHVDVLKRYAI